jgi:glutamate-1-semialdehyde 2,1-aminomutase
MEQLCGAGVAFGGTFNGNPLSLAIAEATLTELARDGGAAITRANETGQALRAGIEGLAARHGVPLTVAGFGAAFALHFTTRSELRDYRDTLDDDADRLSAVLARALAEGLHLLPDGRLYLSAAHGPSEVTETLAAFDQILAEQGAPVPAPRG